MRIDWLRRDGSGALLVFFNGWGMDTGAVAHLQGNMNVAVCSDYRSLDTGEVPCFSDYDSVYIAAWSMGVWAAANTVPGWRVRVEKAVALNGTECPIDDRYGIPVRNYELTERGMTEQGREKFFSRMFADKAGYESFSAHASRRNLPEQVEELRRIHLLSSERKDRMKWDRVFISGKDLIFPAENQARWWRERASAVLLAGGHYPFYEFRSWEEVLGI